MKTTDKMNWMQDCMRRVMVGFHVPDTDQTSFPADKILSEVDPHAIVRQVKKTGAQAFWYYSKCHRGNAYYPSKVGHVHSALRGRDLFDEFTQACLAEGIVPCGVYEFSDRRLPTDKPDWCHRVPTMAGRGEVEMTDGVQGASVVSSACLNGPYGDFAIQQAVEVVSKYPIQAYYVDFLGKFDVYRWICPHCGESFKREFGFDFPGDALKLPHEQYVAYLKWHYRQYDVYCKRMLAEIEKVNPDVMFVHNLHGIFNEPCLQTWELAANNCDYYSHDIFTLRDGTLLMSTESRLYADRTRRRGGAAPGEELIDSVVCTKRDILTPKALDGYRAEMWTARACGVASMGSFIMNVDGSTDDHVFALIGKIFSEQKRYEPWLKDMKTLATVALLRSQQTIEHRPPPMSGIVPLHSAEFQGWAQMCIESHQLWNAIQDCHVTAEQLKRYRILVVPHAACLGASQTQAIMMFVRDGGTLIATGESSLFDEAGRRRSDFGLAEVLGLSCRGELKPEHRFLCLRDKRLQPRESWVPSVIVYHEGQMVVKATREASVLADIGDQLPEDSLANQVLSTDIPGLVHSRYGKGQVYYFAGLPGQQYFSYGYHTVRRVVTQVLDQAVGRNAPIRLEAPGTMELFAHTQGDTGNIVINLINNVSGISRSTGRLCNGSSHLEMIENMPPVAEAVLRIRLERGTKLERAYLAPGKTMLKCEKSGTEHVIRLTNLDVHTMIVLETR